MPRVLRTASIRGALAALLAACALAPAPAARAQESVSSEFEDSRRFRRVSFAVHAGFSGWTLSSLESTMEHRADVLAAEGFDLHGADFPSGAAFGVALEVRLPAPWFLRAGADWSRTRTDVRDRKTVSTLVGRRPISFSFETRVDPDPFLFHAGVGRSFHVGPGRLGVSASGILAPMRIEETYEIVIDTTSEITTSASGVGVGGEAAASYDYFTDARMNLYAELFARLGSTTVRLDAPLRESELVPGERDIDFTGVGLRFGFRWI